MAKWATFIYLIWDRRLNQFFKLFYPQINKKALIIDDRGNGGGFVSPIITDRLARQLVFFEMTRNTIGDTITRNEYRAQKYC